MSDGMTDRRGQSEQVVSPKEAEKLFNDIKASIQHWMINETDYFDTMRIDHVKVISEHITALAMTEVGKLAC